MIQTCRTTGDQLVDEDKEAFSEALGGDPPNKLLLRARLLFDGGYYDEAQDVIAGKPIDSFPRYRDQLEVTYRLARILQRQGQKQKRSSITRPRSRTVLRLVIILPRTARFRSVISTKKGDLQRP